ncbi:hypothetical protein TDB9533_02616 [Thalassocella blandensis]|nr:hypothetical protein TDB9533_02616 [Thalassocella blandensis]
MANKILISAFTAILLSACASQDTRNNNAQPDWVMSQSQQYPRSSYLSGVGEADSMSDAKSRARAEIASIFNVTVQSSSSDLSSFQQSSLDQTASHSLEVSRQIDSRSQQRLEGVKIAEMWQDPLTQRYYALAILPRQITAMNLRKDIEQLDSATATLVTRIQQSPSLVQKIRLSGDAIALQHQRRELNKQLQVVSATGQSISSSYPLEKLRQDRTELLSRITVTAEASGSEQNALQSALEDALANQGFSVTPNAAYVIKASLNSTPLPPQGNWYYEKGSLDISLSGENKQSLGGYSWNFKVSSSDPTLTQLRVMEQAKKVLNAELSAKLFELLEKSN